MFLSHSGLGARWAAWSCVMSLMLLSAGCEPTSITEARNQLGRGPARIVQFTIPVAQDTVTVGEFLCPSSSTTPCDTVTTPDGLIGITFDPETLTVNVGDKLNYDSLTFSPFTFGYNQMLQTSQQTVSLNIGAGSFTPAPGISGAPGVPGVSGDTIRFGTSAGSYVLSATIASGRVRLDVSQNSGCTVTFTASLVDSLGNNVVSFPSVVAGSGTPKADSADIVNRTMVGWVRVTASGSLGGVPCVPNPLATASLTLTIRPLTLSSVTLRNLNETFNQSYSPLATETRINTIDSVIVNTGSFKLRVQNRLPIQFKAVITLNGVTRSGVAVKDSLTVAAAPGGGATRTDSLTLNLAGAKIVPGSVTADVQGSATAAQATIDPIVTTNAVVVSGSGNLQSLSAPLDPAKTAELTVSTEEFQEINAGDFDLGDLEDAVKQATLNDAKIQLSIVNSSGAPLKLSNFKLGVVELTSTGQLPRDGSGNIAFQTDAQGAITVAVVDSPSVTTFTIARNSTKSVTLQTARVLDRVIDLVLDNKRAALVGADSVVVGDGQMSTVTTTDSISLRMALTVALDFAVPTAGVTFSKTSVTDGADFGAQDANQIAQRVDTASAIAIVQNGTPFGVQVRIAMVPDSQPATVDADSIFRMTNRTEIGSVSLLAAPVDAQGRVTSPVLDTATVSIAGNKSKVLLGRKLTAAIRVTLLPNASNPRSAIRTTDKVIIRASGSVKIKTGGAP